MIFLVGLQTSGIDNHGRRDQGWTYSGRCHSSNYRSEEVIFSQRILLLIAQSGVILAQQDVFIPIVPVNRKRSENLNFIFISAEIHWL